MNAVVAIVRANLRRLLNDRANIFFLVVLPLLIVFALGSAIGESAGDTRVAVYDPAPTSQSLAIRDAVDSRAGIRVEGARSAGELRRKVARDVVDAGWIVTSTGAGSDAHTAVELVSGISSPGLAVRSVLADAVREVSVGRQVVALVAARARVDVAAAERAVALVPADAARRVTVGSSQVTGEGGTEASIRAVLAGGQLTLFMFLTSLFGASALLLSRQYGVTRRTRAAPVTGLAVIVGEALSRYVVALIQAGIILVGSWALFGVDWRSPVAVLALCAAMALVGSGVAMILGTLGRSEQQVGALALLAGLVLAALGGSMQPLEFFPDAMRTVAFALTPHAWMNDGLWSILVDGAGIGAVWTRVAVLAAVGAVLILVAGRLLASRAR